MTEEIITESDIISNLEKINKKSRFFENFTCIILLFVLE